MWHTLMTGGGPLTVDGGVGILIVVTIIIDRILMGIIVGCIGWVNTIVDNRHGLLRIFLISCKISDLNETLRITTNVCRIGGWQLFYYVLVTGQTGNQGVAG